MALHILSAGAAQGVVSALAARLGLQIEAQFGAVGAMQAKLEAGAPCDLVVLTRRQTDALRERGLVRSAADLGQVRTGVAVRRGDPLPDIATAEALRAALRAAQEIHHPDAVQSTAGVHFARVLAELGVSAEVAARLRSHPNGATAMRALAVTRAATALGCTQITEIRNTSGIELAGPLPACFELATIYTAGVCSDDTQALRFMEQLTGEGSAALRTAAGFQI